MNPQTARGGALVESRSLEPVIGLWGAARSTGQVTGHL